MKTVLWNIVLFLFLVPFEVYCQQCPKLSSPKGGRVRIRAKGRVARFRCARKSILYGSKVLICSGGKWSKPPPICIKRGCEKIKPGKGVKMTTGKKGTLNQFECEEPLNLVGNKILTCDGKQWSGPVPTCEYVEPKVFCDFEDERLCGWKHDATAENEWIWGSGTTPTRKTGPSYDHTFGKDGYGHYVYMESSHPSKEGESARLLSQFYGPTAEGKCFQFWYHLFGQVGPEQVGRLTIYIEETGKPTKTNMFSISENQGDLWIKGNFSIGKREEPFRFVIEGTKMKSHLGDISVDDVRILNCTEESSITTQTVPEKTVDMSTTQSALPDSKTTQFSQTTLQSTEYTEPFADTTSQPVDKSTRKSHVITSMTTNKSTTISGFTTSKILTTSSSKPTTLKVTTEPMVETTSVTSLRETMLMTSKPTTESIVETTVFTTTRKPTMQKTKPIITSSKINKAEGTTQPTTATRPTTIPMTSVTLPSRKPTTSATKSSTKKTYKRTTTQPSSSTEKITTKLQPSISITTNTVETTAPFATEGKKTTMKIDIKTPHKPSIIPTSETTKNIPTAMSSQFDSTTTSLKNRDVLQTSESSQNNSTKVTSINQQIPTTTINSTDNNSETDVSGEKIDPSSLSDVTPVKPLMIGVGVGIAIGLIIVVGAIYIYMKKRRKEDIFEDEMEPIAKNAVYD